MSTDEEYMLQALVQAQMAFEKEEVPVGAIVVMQNKIIGRGHNLTETLKDPTAHAEMMALTAAFAYMGAKYLPDATIYITVEPCHMCAGALYWSKIGNIVYGAADIKNGYRRFLCHCGDATASENKGVNVFHPKTKLITGIMEHECGELMTNFFQRKR